ncbi:MAG: hypothetical protein P8N66_05125 [Porticoccaceae bacterium]|nr:hypothetical protein [Porticoccaceae bacterium]
MPERRSVVVTHREGYKYWFFAAFLGVCIVSFILGIWWQQSRQEELQSEHQALSEQVLRLAQSLDIKTTELEMMRLNTAVDAAALENARQEMIVLQKQIFENEEQLGLYRELLRDGSQPSGLSVAKFSLTQISEEQLAYRWVARQKTVKMQVTNVIAEITVIGNQGDRVLTLPLSDLDSNIVEMPIRLKFKYFSINQGVLSLPEGFNPDKVRVVLRYSWSKKVSDDKTFDWVVEE